MPAANLFESPPATLLAMQLGKVVDVADPDQLGRVQVRLFHFDGVTDHDAAIWARVAVPFAGGKRGAFFLPDVGDEVLVTLLDGDPRLPVVVGGLWNGADKPPETLPGSQVDRWTIVGKAGTRIAIIEQSAGSETISLTTPAGQKVLIEAAGGGKVEIIAAGNTVKLDSAGVSIEAAAKVKVNAPMVEVSAGMVKVDAGMSKFSGVVQCDTLIATTVVSSTYTPGAGNIW